MLNLYKQMFYNLVQPLKMLKKFATWNYNTMHSLSSHNYQSVMKGATTVCHRVDLKGANWVSNTWQATTANI